MDTQGLKAIEALRDSGRIEESLRELRRLAESTTDVEEKGLLVLAEANWLAGAGRVEEGRQRLGQASCLLAGTVEYSARIELASVRLNIAEGKCRSALIKVQRLFERYRQLLRMPEVRDLYEDVQLCRGELLAREGRSQEACPILEEVLTYDVPKDAPFYCHLGACYYWLGRTEEAIQRLLQSLEMGLDGKWACSARYYLGLAYVRVGAYAKARLEFEAAEALADQNGVPKKGIYDGLWRACRGLGLHDEAERYARLAKQG